MRERHRMVLQGVGADVRVVLIDDVSTDGLRVEVIDSFGKRDTIPMYPLRGCGQKPQIGEEWIIDRAFGGWTFAAVIRPDPPEVTGSRGGNAALGSLLNALDGLGLIRNNTTA